MQEEGDQRHADDQQIQQVEPVPAAATSTAEKTAEPLQQAAVTVVAAGVCSAQTSSTTTAAWKSAVKQCSHTHVLNSQLTRTIVSHTLASAVISYRYMSATTQPHTHTHGRARKTSALHRMRAAGVALGYERT